MCFSTAMHYNGCIEAAAAAVLCSHTCRGVDFAMTISQIITALDATLLTPDADCAREVHTACGSDMMSDVLAYVKDQAVLLTGLNNPQVVRTADMMDMICIVFVRGKRPSSDIIDMAIDRGMCIMSTRHTLYVACGILYQKGVLHMFKILCCLFPSL